MKDFLTAILTGIKNWWTNIKGVIEKELPPLIDSTVQPQLQTFITTNKAKIIAQLQANNDAQLATDICTLLKAELNKVLGPATPAATPPSTPS